MVIFRCLAIVITCPLMIIIIIIMPVAQEEGVGSMGFFVLIGIYYLIS